MRRLNDSTREALEGEIVNLEYDKAKIDGQIEAIRNLLARDRVALADPNPCDCGDPVYRHKHAGVVS